MGQPHRSTDASSNCCLFPRTSLLSLHYPEMSLPKSDLLRSHRELRAALRLAEAEIRKLNFGRKETPLLFLLRRIAMEARNVAAIESAKKTNTDA